ncbi:MAG: hypothetical protein U0800_01655 [Isosphaeraceae bacterium]
MAIPRRRLTIAGCMALVAVAALDAMVLRVGLQARVAMPLRGILPIGLLAHAALWRAIIGPRPDFWAGFLAASVAGMASWWAAVGMPPFGSHRAFGAAAELWSAYGSLLPEGLRPLDDWFWPTPFQARYDIPVAIVTFLPQLALALACGAAAALASRRLRAERCR